MGEDESLSPFGGVPGNFDSQRTHRDAFREIIDHLGGESPTADVSRVHKGQDRSRKNKKNRGGCSG